MRSFQIVALSALAIGASADAPPSSTMDTLVYDATVYITSTVTRVNTITISSSTPGYTPVNMTSTIPATHATIVPSYPVNSTMVASTGVIPTASAPSASGPVPSSTTTPFEGAASTLNVNAFVVALAAGVGYLVL
ncbi:hypothetical protein PtrSN002B_009421 [Pyrenophora tritici-repentis]|uniref:Tymo-45kd-70kd multi-domain protein n=2 Tax=Pyrenophora tritici-repentis TaxID=45151 RepID=A0A2W1EUJ5_9PLEO|nr:uncharacterized protein PTRG_06742 [Pyrenophora tritici-repentis Pt-1C-BFP]KAA8613851.1 hypothetical protein PtrV1_12759 [Pyrenophora tritici-repentis]EDU49662.1 predicted protein [Pyrenophora tritici-repentis Pt-1C-BFP]KAF7445571.1 hypothetical protein A1F99_105570 [Pyrenophora tritici-repentis]KAF7565856.1 Tymo-45kd-70kd multi-domain protein [Pyrenophora tritici-repentis]KAG9380051.1 hypothetical protein A1F94_008946 [Pyrenophora tritici-repentis]